MKAAQVRDSPLHWTGRFRLVRFAFSTLFVTCIDEIFKPFLLFKMSAHLGTVIFCKIVDRINISEEALIFILLNFLF